MTGKEWQEQKKLRALQRPPVPKKDDRKWYERWEDAIKFWFNGDGEWYKKAWHDIRAWFRKVV